MARDQTLCLGQCLGTLYLIVQFKQVFDQFIVICRVENPVIIKSGIAGTARNVFCKGAVGKEPVRTFRNDRPDLLM